MSEEVKVEESSGNVFLDMGFSEEEAEREQLRSYLAYHVYSLFEELKLTPAKAKRALELMQMMYLEYRMGIFIFLPCRNYLYS